jgi:hydrogenase expression/formation protein HypD
MKYLDEYRDPELARSLVQTLEQLPTRSWTIMEICGGQTHTLLRSGIDRLLPSSIRLVHGPGCPVCVTPLEMIDRALAVASRPEVIFCSFGDMLRVPGSSRDLLRVRAEGGDVRIVYSPLDAVKIAKDNPTREVVFFAVGFETTAPVTALAAIQARNADLRNFSMLVSHVLVPPAMEAILADPACQIQGFLAAGHVCTVVGFEDYERIAARYRIPIVVTGFEPIDLLEGIRMVVAQLEQSRAEVENQYARSVRREGNERARSAILEVYEVSDQAWRGLGIFPQSGLRLNAAFRAFDATYRFAIDQIRTVESSQCRSGEVLRGLLRPTQCAAFGTLCTPETPLGAPMVSSEGACAAYYQHRGHSGSQGDE